MSFWKKLAIPVTAPVAAVRKTKELLDIRSAAVRLMDLLKTGRDDWDARTPDTRAYAVYLQKIYWLEVLTALRDTVIRLPLPSAWMRYLDMSSWKTTLAGIGACVAVIVKVLTATPIHVTAEDYGAFMVGIGLILAKDFDKTHSTPPPAASAP